jgi:NADH-quinone oxidoreductase subunit N
MNPEALYSWSAILPPLVILAAAVISLVTDLFARPGSRMVPWITFAGLLAGFVTSVAMWGRNELAFSGFWSLSSYSLFFDALFCAASALVVLLSLTHEERRGRFPGEYYILLQFSVVGMMVMASANELITLVIGLETMSLPAYVLVGANRGDRRATEGALKYFLLGAFATAFLIYGTALVYGAAATTRFGDLVLFLNMHTDSPGTLMYAGTGLLLVGFGFKIASVPFHMWAPDAYQAAPTPITAFMATAMKAAGLAAVLRIYGILFAEHAPALKEALWVLSLASMIVGNLAAVVQPNLKRMLAYSSIAHVGYILTAVVASQPSTSPLGGVSVLFYVVAYALMTLGAFAVLVVAGGGTDRRETLPDFAGFAGKHPTLALAMAIFMISLSGIPPTAGFFGKFHAFGAAVQSGYVGQAVVGVLTSVIGVFYYLRVVVYMYMRSPEKSYRSDPRPFYADATVLLLAIAVIYTGLFPQSLLQLARAALTSLL